MQKALLTTMLSLMLLFSLTACWGGGDKKADSMNSEQSALERNGIPSGQVDENRNLYSAYNDDQKQANHAPDNKSLGDDLKKAGEKIVKDTEGSLKDAAGSMREAGKDVEGAVKNTQRDVTSMTDKAK